MKALIRETFPEDPAHAIAIASCESGLTPTAYNSNNKNGSVDRGLFQINSTHDKTMEAFGLDPWDVEDNVEFARYLYEQSLWRPWVCNKLIAMR